MIINKQYFSNMTFKEKVKYVIYYYGLYVLGAAALIAFIIFLSKPFIQNIKYNTFILILNDNENNALVDKIKSEFPQYLNNKKYVLDVSNRYHFDYIEEHNINWPDQETQFRIISYLSSNQADVAIADYKTMLWAVHTEFITPINNILSQEMFEKLKPYYVNAYDEKVYGLDISNTNFYKNNKKKYEDAVIIIPNITKQKEIAVKFIEYVFELTTE